MRKWNSSLPCQHVKAGYHRPTGGNAILMVFCWWADSDPILNRSSVNSYSGTPQLKKVLLPHPLGNFADISYLEENFKPYLLRDVCSLCSGALVSDNLLHILLQQTKIKSKRKFELQKEDINISNYSNLM